MKSANWKGAAEAFGITAIVASLIFVGLELRQAHKIALSELAHMTAEDERDSLALSLEHADIWARGNAGKDLEPAEALIYADLMKIKWSMVFWDTFSIRQLGSTDDIALHDFSWFLHENTGAREAWELMVNSEIQRRKLLVSEEPGSNRMDIEMVSIVRGDLAKLGELEP